MLAISKLICAEQLAITILSSGDSRRTGAQRGIEGQDIHEAVGPFPGNALKYFRHLIKIEPRRPVKQPGGVANTQIAQEI